MKKTTVIILLAILQFTAYAQQTYQLDIKKSKVLWNNGHTMGGHYGYLLFNSGSLGYAPSGEPSDGTFSMDMNSVRSQDDKDVTGNLATDKAIKKPNFFDIAKYPEAFMTIKQITRIDQTTSYKVSGDLTIKGITNPIVFTAIIKKAGNSLNVMADTKIHRLKYHIDMQEQPKKEWDFLSAIKNEVVDDEIAISLKLVFNKM
ncbi:MAG: YceI family protein [Bacteroidota bacterium]